MALVTTTTDPLGTAAFKMIRLGSAHSGEVAQTPDDEYSTLIALSGWPSSRPLDRSGPVQARVADADGPGSATAYVASGQVHDADTATVGDVSATRYYTFAGSTVAVRTDDGQLALMLGDEQGSTSVMMPVTVTASGTLASATLADAAAVTRTAYT
ncbi:hypothetical protein LGT39_00430, partial [Demequina sp. TTPB684]